MVITLKVFHSIKNTFQRLLRECDVIFVNPFRFHNSVEFEDEKIIFSFLSFKNLFFFDAKIWIEQKFCMK